MAKQDPSSYEVGYGKPPAAKRFKKGASGNSLGRPRDSKNLRLLLEQELGSKIAITENGRHRSISKLAGMLKRLVNQAVAGKERSAKLILEYVREAESSQSPFRDRNGVAQMPIEIAREITARVENARRLASKTTS